MASSPNNPEKYDNVMTGHGIDGDGNPVRSLADAENVQNFWTPERMRQAKSLDGVLVNRDGSTETVGAAPAAAQPISSPPVVPPEMTTAGQVSDSDSPVVGRMFAQDPTSGGYLQCSASVVGGSSGNVVLTAAHCLWDPAAKVQYTNVVFAPGYHDGVAPYGLWSQRDWLWHVQWHDHNKWHYDYGYIVLFPRSDGTRIVDRVGALGFRVNEGSFENIDAMGYPALSPYDGEQQKRDNAYAEKVDFVVGAPPELDGFFERIVSDFTGGSSGGPWVAEYSTTTRVGWAQGVISFSFSGDPYQFSPYFDDETWRLYEMAGRLPLS